MNEGMLWFDNDPKTTLSAKIERAAKYYEQKYGAKPNLCLINPSALEGTNTAENVESADSLKSAQSDITVRPYRPVLPGHLWIGFEEKN